MKVQHKARTSSLLLPHWRSRAREPVLIQSYVETFLPRAAPRRHLNREQVAIYPVARGKVEDWFAVPSSLTGTRILSENRSASLRQADSTADAASSVGTSASANVTRAALAP